MSGFSLVKASAGSGKTFTLVNNIQKLIESGVNQESILAFTFTNYATDDLKLKLKDYPKITLGTMHSVFNTILMDLLNREAKKYKLNFVRPTLMKDIDVEWFVKRYISKNLKAKKQLGKNVNDIILAIQHKINNLLLPRATSGELDRLIIAFENHKKDNNLITFDDMLQKTYYLFRGNKEYAERWAKKWEYIFVDEFQDSNILQVELLKFLSSHHKNLFAIGDFKQSIYGFRGGNPDLLLNFNSHFSGAEISTLPKTYRNSKLITNLANGIVHEMFSKFGEEPIDTNSEHLGEIEMKRFHSEDDEINYIVKNLSEEEDTLVLTRTNAEIVNIEIELIKKRIHYKILGDNYFYKNKHITNLLNLLVLFSFDETKKSTEYILSTLSWFSKFFTKESKNILLNKGISVSELRTIKLENVNDKKSLNMLADKIQFVKTTAKSVSDIAYRALATMSYDEYIEDKEQKDEALVSKLTLQYFISAISDFNSITDVFNFIKLSKKAEHSSKIRLSTIHKSKGLEAEKVIIPFVEKGKFPLEKKESNNAFEEPFDINSLNQEIQQKPKYDEEEDRLLYVAITRPKTQLIITTHNPSYYFTILKKYA